MDVPIVPSTLVPTTLTIFPHTHTHTLQPQGKLKMTDGFVIGEIQSAFTAEKIA